MTFPCNNIHHDFSNGPRPLNPVHGCYQRRRIISKPQREKRWTKEDGVIDLALSLQNSIHPVGVSVMRECWEPVSGIWFILFQRSCFDVERRRVHVFDGVSAVLGKSFMSEWEGVGQGCCGECLKFRGMFGMLFGFCWWVGEDRYLLLNLVRSSWKINKCVLIFTSQSVCEILRFL